jgi:hypothetical protein
MRLRASVANGKEPEVLCGTCDPKRAGEALRAQMERFLLDAEQNEVPHGFRTFAKPIPAIVERNPQWWAWGETWVLAGSPWNRGNVLAWGDVGVGKSSFCRMLLTKAIKVERGVYDLACCEIEEWTKLGYEQQNKLDRAKYVSCLLLDDIDNVQWSAKGINLLRSIVNVRHEPPRRTTLVTSNMSPADLFKKICAAYGGNQDAAQSLLERLRPFEEMEFRGTSYRKEMA